MTERVNWLMYWLYKHRIGEELRETLDGSTPESTCIRKKEDGEPSVQEHKVQRLTTTKLQQELEWKCKNKK